MKEAETGGAGPAPAGPDPSHAETVVRPSGEPASADATRIVGAVAGGGAAPERIGRYEIRGLLGRGGMGAVYRAFDTQLKRDVALKMLRLEPGESGEMFQRFRQEAEAAAKLRHPNLVAVFDLGSEGGQPFMTMELLEGGSLGGLLVKRGGKLAPNEAMRLVRDVALGLACAHEKGIVHRDLKPENILLEPGEVLRPKIADFGLAQTVRRAGDARMTVHGSILGTPAYMAPEQAEGNLDQVDARSDVYALGAVLYEAASGRPAYGGRDPMAVILEKLENDPPPPRGLGRDLETIILKAMAREPERRYATARELAEDLDRCLSGAAILARPESATEALLRWIRRHRGLTAASAIIAACLAIAGIAAWRANSERDNKRRLEQEALSSLRSVAETNLFAILAIRRAGVPVAQQEPFLPRVEAAAAKAMEITPASPEPHYRLGRAYRALQRFEAALAEQERALAKDAAYGPALYERAILDLRRWEARLAELRAAWTLEEGRRLAQRGELESVGKLPAPPPDAELAAQDGDASRLRDRIEGDLAALERAAPGGAEASCLRGLVQLHGATEAEQAEGAARVERALAGDPLLEEAYEGLARAAQAQREFEEAARQYARGMEKDAGYVPLRLGRASVAHDEAERAMAFGGDPLPACERAAADLTEALRLQPGLREALLSRGNVLRLQADRMGETGKDPVAGFERALADLTAAVESAPDRADGWLARGVLHATWGYWKRDRADDPEDRFKLAVADFDAAIRRAPQNAAAWGGRGDVRRNWGRFLKNRGDDPRGLYGEALEDYTQALSLDPRSVALWRSRSAVRQGLSVFARLRGDAAWRALLEDARADLDRALELEPLSAWILGMRAENDILLAGCLVQDGENPAAVYARAIADYDALLRVQRGPSALIGRATCRTQWAEYEQALGRDPSKLVALAREDLEAARPGAAGNFTLGVELGRLETLEARMGDPLPHLQRAREALTESIRLNADATEAYMRRGMAAHLEGAWRAGRGEDPEPAWTAAVADFDRALAINGKWEQVWLGRGLVKLDRAARAGSADAFASALADLEKVVAVNPIYVDGWRMLAEAKRRAGRLEEARADAVRAVTLGPNHAAARLERARVLLALGDRAAAARDLDWVGERVPAWKDEVARLRAK